MSLIDNVAVHPKWLPADAPDWLRKDPDFQTHDLGDSLGQYVINENGRLMLDTTSTIGGSILCEAFEIPEEKKTEIPPMDMNYKRKRIELYGSDFKSRESVVYIAQFRNGRLSSLKSKA